MNEDLLKSLHLFFQTQKESKEIIPYPKELLERVSMHITAIKAMVCLTGKKPEYPDDTMTVFEDIQKLRSELILKKLQAAVHHE